MQNSCAERGRACDIFLTRAVRILSFFMHFMHKERHPHDGTGVLKNSFIKPFHLQLLQDGILFWKKYSYDTLP